MRVVIGDVTGHGFKSGIVVATAKSFFQAYGKSMEPAELMEQISNGIKGLGLRKMYMGLALIEIHHDRIRLWSSGLPSFYRYSKAKDEIDIIRKPGMFLGSSIQPNYESTEWIMEEGDALVAMTDGFPEGIEQYFHSPASPIISQYIRQQQQHSARRMLYSLMGLSLQWRKKELSKDDITLLVLKQKTQEV